MISLVVDTSMECSNGGFELWLIWIWDSHKGVLGSRQIFATRQPMDGKTDRERL